MRRSEALNESLKEEKSHTGQTTQRRTRGASARARASGPRGPSRVQRAKPPSTALLSPDSENPSANNSVVVLSPYVLGWLHSSRSLKQLSDKRHSCMKPFLKASQVYYGQNLILKVTL